MRKLLSSLIFLVIYNGSFCCTCSAETEQSIQTLISIENYIQVLDSVFTELPQTGVLPLPLDYSIILRFMPSFLTESEVLIQVSYNGVVRVILFTITGESVWDSANDYIQRTGRFDLDAIVKNVQVKRKQISVSTKQASSWYSDALKNLGLAGTELKKNFEKRQKSGEVEIFLDGATYELRIRQGMTEVRWTIMDAEVNDRKITGLSSLAKWMNKIRLQLNHDQ